VRRLDGLGGLSPGLLRNPVATVGIFDGVHRGHRQLLYELSVWARSVGGEACVLTFHEHPLSVLEGIDVAPVLTLDNRLLELERHGVDATVLLHFGDVKDMGPKDFLRSVLDGRLGCRRLLLGFDSHIGKGRAGTPANLPSIGRELGIEVRIASPVLDRHGRKIGSSAIREAIRAGDLEAAANMLGHPLTVRGPVVRGAGRGRALGVPTANLELGRQLLPPDGVYLVRVFHGGETAPAVANLGVRPTFGEGGARGLEVHVPGWSADLYGETLEVRFVRRLRDERKFDGAAALRAGIAQDLEALARSVARGEV
jgi:riboflavin kinase/FMN adenylyltransferase